MYIYVYIYISTYDYFISRCFPAARHGVSMPKKPYESPYRSSTTQHDARTEETLPGKFCGQSPTVCASLQHLRQGLHTPSRRCGAGFEMQAGASIQLCDMPSCMCGTCFILVFDIPHVCVSCLIHVCHLPHSCVSHA